MQSRDPVSIRPGPHPDQQVHAAQELAFVSITLFSAPFDCSLVLVVGGVLQLCLVRCTSQSVPWPHCATQARAAAIMRMISLGWCYKEALQSLLF